MKSSTSRAGVVKPGNEMITAGKNYEYSIHIINSLIKEKTVSTLKSIPEEKEKKKKKKVFKEII